MEAILGILFIIGFIYLVSLSMRVGDKAIEASTKLENKIFNKGKGPYFCAKKRTWVQGD